MSRGRQVHRGATRLLSIAMIVIGVAILVRTIAGGGIGLTYGIVIGVLFLAAGVGRLWVSERGG